MSWTSCFRIIYKIHESSKFFVCSLSNLKFWFSFSVESSLASQLCVFFCIGCHTSFGHIWRFSTKIWVDQGIDFFRMVDITHYLEVPFPPSQLEEPLNSKITAIAASKRILSFLRIEECLNNIHFLPAKKKLSNSSAELVIVPKTLNWTLLCSLWAPIPLSSWLWAVAALGWCIWLHLDKMGSAKNAY